MAAWANLISKRGTATVPFQLLYVFTLSVRLRRGQAASQIHRLPVSAAPYTTATLTCDMERHMFAGLERGLDARHILRRINRLAIDFQNNIVLLQPDPIGERARIHRFDHHTASPV